MISWIREAVATGKVTHALGPDPVGYIAYHAVRIWIDRRIADEGGDEQIGRAHV